jgi:hypothetical protein
MVYACKRCNYTTTVKCNYDRHISRKNPCKTNVYTIIGNGNEPVQNINVSGQNINISEQNINDPGQNINDSGQNINDSGTVVLPNKHPTSICNKCNKTFSNKRIQEHQRKCDGLNSKQCKNCKKMFSFWQSKHAHNKNVKCKNYEPPPPPPPQQSINNHIHAETIHDLTINNNINNVVVNLFGKEDTKYLLNDENILQQLIKYAKKNMYGFADIIKQIHCNNDEPENNTIIKPHEYGDGVYIMGEGNKREYREFEDVRDTLINSVNRFVEVCEDKRIDGNIRFNDKKERYFIKQLCIKLLSIGGDVPLNLMEELQIKVKDNDDLDKDNIRKFDKATMVKLHEFTQANYKKNNGSYIKNDLKET